MIQRRGKRRGSRDSRLVWRYSCRKCDQEMELRFPRGVKIARRPIATCERCGSKMESHKVKGFHTRQWFRNTNFRFSEIEKFPDLTRVREFGFEQTSESKAIGMKIATRLSRANPWRLQGLPYISKSSLSASALTSKGSILQRLERENGVPLIPRNGSPSDKGEAIDCAIIEFDRNGEIDGLTTQVSNYRTRVEALSTDDVDIVAEGHPDLEVIESGKPIEIKSLSSFSKFESTGGRGFDPMGKFSKFKRQTAFYQLSEKENKGFLALISRSTGDVVCVEADPNNVSDLQRDWASWVEDEEWRRKVSQLMDSEGGFLNGL